MIEIAILNFQIFTNDVHTLMRVIKMVNCLGSWQMDLQAFVPSGKFDFQCSVLTLVMNKMVTQVYVLYRLG